MVSVMTLSLFILVVFHRKAISLRCYECTSNLSLNENDACLSGNWWHLRRVNCLGPSVCASYIYTAASNDLPLVTTVTRGCQALRYGGTCEDIYNYLRSIGSIMPGHHTCSTCSTDLCNSSMKAGSSRSAIVCLALFVVFMSVTFH